MEKFAKTETKLKRKKAVENKTETETEKYFTTEITLQCQPSKAVKLLFTV